MAREVVVTFTRGLEVVVGEIAVGAGGVADHGALTGLADDDHLQYHNDARGDLRYDPIGAAAAAQVAAEATHTTELGTHTTDGDAHGAATALATHVAAPDPHPTYLTQAEGDSFYDIIGAAAAAQTAAEATAATALGAHTADGDAHGAATALAAHAATQTAHGDFLLLDCSNDPITGALTTQAVTPDTNQTRGLGTDSNRFFDVRGRIGVFVGSSDASGGISTGGARLFGDATPAGLMAGNSHSGGAGAATHFLQSGAFKGVACVGNVFASSTGYALMSNRSGGSCLFGSAYTAGAGNAILEATSFGNFTAAYSYAGANTHRWSNNAAGGFLAGYSAGAATTTITNSGAGCFTSVRTSGTGIVAVDNAGEGGFVQGRVTGTLGATNRLRTTATGDGGFAQGIVSGANAEITASEAGAFAQGQANASVMTASGAGSFAHGRAASGNAITASSAGALAVGDSASGTIVASAVNANQFGPGTNAQPDSLAVGDMAGTGLRLIAAGAPATPVNGDFWQANGSIYCRTGGVTKNLDLI